MAYLNQAYDSLKETLTTETLNDDRVNGFHSALDHITHHRAQCIVYLRINGITAPEYSH